MVRDLNLRAVLMAMLIVFGRSAAWAGDPWTTPVAVCADAQIMLVLDGPKTSVIDLRTGKALYDLNEYCQRKVPLWPSGPPSITCASFFGKDRLCIGLSNGDVVYFEGNFRLGPTAVQRTNGAPHSSSPMPIVAVTIVPMAAPQYPHLIIERADGSFGLWSIDQALMLREFPSGRESWKRPALNSVTKETFQKVPGRDPCPDGWRIVELVRGVDLGGTVSLHEIVKVDGRANEKIIGPACMRCERDWDCTKDKGIGGTNQDKCAGGTNQDKCAGGTDRGKGAGGKGKTK